MLRVLFSEIDQSSLMEAYYLIPYSLYMIPATLCTISEGWIKVIIFLHGITLAMKLV